MKLQKNYLIDGEIRIIEKQEDSLIKSKNITSEDAKNIILSVFEHMEKKIE